jgi:hypothetical protein
MFDTLIDVVLILWTVVVLLVYAAYLLLPYILFVDIAVELYQIIN